MSKFKKLLVNPNLFFKDAYLNLNRKMGLIEKTVSNNPTNKKSIVNDKKHNFLMRRNKPKLFLVIFFTEKLNFNFFKKQLYSIDKYTDFYDVFLICDQDVDTSYVRFDNYNSFYNTVVREKSLDTNFVFINDKFFFAKKCTRADFYSSNESPYIFIKENLQYFDQKNILDLFYNEFDCFINSTPIKSLVSCNTLNLVAFNDYTDKIKNDEDFIFVLLPLIMLYFNTGTVRDPKIININLQKDYSQSLVWLLSSRGSSGAALGLSIFNTQNADFEILNDFLISYYPHDF